MIHDMQQSMLIAFGVVNALLISLSQVSLWQRKEYRIDRMKAHLLSPEGSLYKEWFVIAQGVFLFLAFLSDFEILAIASLLSIFFGHAFRIYKKGVFRPDFTLRAILVLACTALVAIGATTLLALQFATSVFLLPLFVALSVGIVALPAVVQKKRVINQATAYRNHLKNLTVVGITGSVGKTSTKTYLTHLLGGESETVRATSEHRNSPYSVAQDMLARLSQKTKVYIAEMGAYIPGEIAELAGLTKPTIGIITAITNQHVALFGSLEALANTKWELIRALPKDGIAILHKDDIQIGKQAQGLQKKTVWFSLKTQADISFSDIVLHQKNTVCTVVIGQEKHDVLLPIISRGQLVPVLAATAAAHALNVETATILKRLASLPIISRTMELRQGKSGAIIIDDSYSASEASVTNAIEYLKETKPKDARLVLVSIIELGAEGSVVHERIGKLLTSLSARVYIYGHAYKEDFVRGLGVSPQVTMVWYDDANILQRELMRDMTEKTVVLLEGRIPKSVRGALL